ncbi:MAG: hypothetical protein V3S21_08445, partial [Xanthomonadales bacterium]
VAPDVGITIGSSYTFSATVIDVSGVKSVSFTIRYPNNSTTQTFSASKGTDDSWKVSLQGFSDGSWSWKVVAKDKASKGGNTGSTDWVLFTVDTSGGGDGGSGGGGGTGTDTITNAEWTGGVVQNAAGRLYFEMPKNGKWKGPWAGYVCSATVVYDGDRTDGDDRSVILTAAHCVYDDVNKAFARNVLFIPNQADTTSTSGTDLNCGNDPLGCWVPSFGVVDDDWTKRTFPNNIPWDYAYYVVSNSGAHTGTGSEDDILDVVAGDMAMDFGPPAPVVNDGTVGKESPDFTHALGYSYSEDPKFMYCAEDMTTVGDHNWWLPSCELSGGSSGGPWVQKMGTEADLAGYGDGPVISVNSWGYTTSPGMAGPKLSGTSAQCVFDKAIGTGFSAVSTADGKAGIAVCK